MCYFVNSVQEKTYRVGKLRSKCGIIAKKAISSKNILEKGHENYCKTKISYPRTERRHIEQI